MPHSSLTHTPTRPLVIDGVSRSFGDRRVLSDISFTASPGDRLALIGENGTGKSTLLRIAAGLDTADAGSVSRPPRTGMLAQELPFPATTPVRAVLDDALAEPLAALADIERAAAGVAADPSDDASAELYSAALDRAELLGAWQIEPRVAAVLSGLSLGAVPHDRPIGELSGGERVRLALAALLLAAPDALLLDEPSNHLDDAAIAYLESVLTDWRGLVVFASHDRTLIDRVATRVLDLDPRALRSTELADAASFLGQDPAGAEPAAKDQGATERATTDDPGAGMGVRVHGTRPGGYSALRAERAAELRRWRDRYAAEQRSIADLTHEIEVGSREVNRKHESKSESRISKKFYSDKDSRVTARRARNATVRLETLERDRVRRPPKPLRFAGIGDPDEPRADTPTLLEATDLSVHGRLAPVSLRVSAGGRILITGPNGSGKSTLLRVIAGELAADGGVVTLADGMSCALLHQETTFVDPSRTAEAWYFATLGADLAEERPLAGAGLLSRRDLGRPVGQLSIGQQRRVALAALVARPPEILLLDEPSNHLSLALVDELEEALSTFAGAVVIASHDRWLRERWAGHELRISPAQPAGSGHSTAPVQWIRDLPDAGHQPVTRPEGAHR